MARAGEDELIARYLAPLAGPGGLLLQDDAALLAPPPGSELVLTADALVAGVHFLPDDPPASIARKALGVNASDLAAKGAEPQGFLLSLALPDGWTEAWLAAFCDGLGEAARAFGCPLLGGDTVRMPGPLTLSITAIGSVPAGRMVRRTSAGLGERICITGTIGDAAFGLKLVDGTRPAWADALSGEDAAALIDRYRHPRPRLALAAALRDHASAAMDVSDGLAGDLAKMLRASGIGAEIDLDAVPLSAPARAVVAADPASFDLALTGGDDYEVLCTVKPDSLPALEAAARDAGIPLAAIGWTAAATGLVARRGGRPRPLVPASFSHF